MIIAICPAHKSKPAEAEWFETDSFHLCACILLLHLISQHNQSPPDISKATTNKSSIDRIDHGKNRTKQALSGTKEWDG